jgi:hypothetical protein
MRRIRPATGAVENTTKRVVTPRKQTNKQTVNYEAQFRSLQ